MGICCLFSFEKAGPVGVGDEMGPRVFSMNEEHGIRAAITFGLTNPFFPFCPFFPLPFVFPGRARIMFVSRVLALLGMVALASAQIRIVQDVKVQTSRKPVRNAGAAGQNVDSFYVTGTISALQAGNLLGAITNTANAADPLVLNLFSTLGSVATDTFLPNTCTAKGTNVVECKITNANNQAGQPVQGATGYFYIKQIRTYPGEPNAVWPTAGAIGANVVYAFKWKGTKRDIGLWSTGAPVFGVRVNDPGRANAVNGNPIFNTKLFGTQKATAI